VEDRGDDCGASLTFFQQRRKRKGRKRGGSRASKTSEMRPALRIATLYSFHLCFFLLSREKGEKGERGRMKRRRTRSRSFYPPSFFGRRERKEEKGRGGDAIGDGKHALLDLDAYVPIPSVRERREGDGARRRIIILTRLSLNQQLSRFQLYILPGGKRRGGEKKKRGGLTGHGTRSAARFFISSAPSPLL